MGQKKIKRHGSKRAQLEKGLRGGMGMIGGQPRISSSALARALGVSQERMNDLVLEHYDELQALGPIVRANVDKIN